MKTIAKCSAIIVWLTVASAQQLHSQVIFSAAADFNGRQGIGLFQAVNGTATPILTGFVEHNFPSVSRDNRFITFSSPDGVIPALQVPPSSDIYIYDRLTGTTTRSVNYETVVFSPSVVTTNIPVSAVLSPNNQFLAYGVSITQRTGTANPLTTKELNIADPATGIILHNPTALRGPTSDSFQSEFVGLSWDPDGQSFVTPFYVNLISQQGTAIQLPAITRFTRNPSDGTWNPTAVLSTPQYLNAVFPPQAVTHIYPSISPSGAGLAYFEIFWPDPIGGSQAVVARIILANSDGSNPQVLSTFNQGFYPVGLAWSPDGTSLVFSIAPQMSIGTGFLASANAPSAIVRTISTSDGTISQLPGIDLGFFTTWRGFGLNGPVNGVRLNTSVSDGGQFRLNATGVLPDLIYFLQSSDSPAGNSFGPTQSFTGQQLLEGININFATPNRFFRLIQQ